MKRLGILVLFFVIGCGATYQIQTDVKNLHKEKGRNLALFLDGTANDLDSRTNVARLSEMVKNQNLDNLHVFYNEGVGTGYRLIGGGTGWGMDKDIVEAYAFLSEFYREESNLFIFGFSRGAYGSRILAGMVYSVGLYDLSSLSPRERMKVSRALYDSFKAVKKIDFNDEVERKVECRGKSLFRDECEILDKSQEVMEEYGLTNVKHYDDVKIEALGLWDTVEALGIVPTIEAMYRNVFEVSEDIEVVAPNLRYIDQICNVNQVLHALSLDDNREFVFTPISIKSNFVISRCPQRGLGTVKEVWFAGAHADVGGGYKPREQFDEDLPGYFDVSLSGISLNWMLAELRKNENGRRILPLKGRFPENIMAYSHDAEDSSFLYENKTRCGVIANYCKKAYGALRLESSAPVSSIQCTGERGFVIHHSVMKRLADIGKRQSNVKGAACSPEQNSGRMTEVGFDSEWYLHDVFKGCFEETDHGLEFLPKQCSTIRLVGNP